jgi:glucosamine--fructose-6-phosphate aminotransferase (isomerizing)
MLAALADLALRWGAARGRPTGKPRSQLAGTAALAEAAATAPRGALQAVAARLAGRAWVSFLGAGPAEASARFGAAKLAESAQLPGLPANLEEWAHEHYFCTGKATPVIVVAPSGAGRDRADEILAELVFIGADAVLLSDTPPADPAITHIPLPATGEEFAPIVAAVPLSLLGFHVAAALGKRSYNFPSPEAEREHYATIHRATVGAPA